MPISDDYTRLDCLSIVINRDGRQRTKIDTSDLEPSIAKHGVLKPIIVTRESVLVAGERRLTASLRLGLDSIPVRYIDGLSAEELQIVELEENLKRADLSWQDQVKAAARIHNAYVGQNLPGMWTESHTAEELCMSKQWISRLLRLAEHMGDPTISGQSTLVSAYGCLQRKQGRKEQEAMSLILEGGQDLLEAALAGKSPEPVAMATPVAEAESPNDIPMPPSPPAGGFKAAVLSAVKEAAIVRPKPSSKVPVPDNLICADFMEWAPSYSGSKFNFLHCDFPYGVGLFDGNRLKSDHAYEDTKDLYFALCETLCTNLDRLLAPNAHVMFWFSMSYYAQTLQLFRKHCPDIIFIKHPLIWVKSDNAGLLTDRNRNPRHIYETALMGIRGDRYVVKAKSDAYSAPTDRTLHPSAKPEPVLKHFFEMFVDSGTTMLDPTCGGGSALRAAEALGALRTFGLERDEATHAAALGALHQSRQLAAAAKAQMDLPL